MFLQKTHPFPKRLELALKGATKITHNEAFKETNVQLGSKCSLVSSCSSPGFCPAQQTWLLAVFGKVSMFKMQELDFFDPYKQVPTEAAVQKCS